MFKTVFINADYFAYKINGTRTSEQQALAAFDVAATMLRATKGKGVLAVWDCKRNCLKVVESFPDPLAYTSAVTVSNLCIQAK
jgi:hypothetical protein